MEKQEPFVSACCRGEICRICSKPATKKVEETIFSDDPFQYRHPMTAYVCEKHFNLVMLGRKE